MATNSSAIANPLWSQRRLKVLLGAALIAAAGCIAYFPALNGGFILDDDLLVTDNQLIAAPDGLYRLWCTTEPADYWPVTNSSFWIEWRLWGMNPTGYHVTNFLLHIAGALLIWTMLNRLSIPGAWLAALLFSVHPVNVESVAWIAQRKNTLSMLFFLLSILWYLKANQSLGRWYWLSLLAFTLAMLSKGSVAILPMLLLLLAWWQRGSITKRDLARTAPFFVVAVVLTAVNVWFQTHGSAEAIRNVTFLDRLLGAGSVVWFYLYKALLPVNLLFIYPQWNIQASDWRWWAPLVAAVAVTAALLWQRNHRLGRPLLFAWLFFCVSLAPVMGFTDVGFMQHSLVADHYQHIAVIGVVAIVAAAWSIWHRQLGVWTRRWALTAAVAVVGALMVLSWNQSSLHADAVTLYETTLSKNPNCWILHNNLGNEYNTRGHYQDAIEHYQQALQLKPEIARFHNNLGVALSKSGRPEEAIQHLHEALRLQPDYAEAHGNLGLCLSEMGRVQEGMASLEESLRLNPDYADAHFNLGFQLAKIGQTQQAIEHYEQALRLRPRYPTAHNNLGNVLKQAGRLPEAIEHYQQALSLNPDYPEALNNLAQALQQTGQIPEAIRRLEQALQLEPDYPPAHNNLGNLLMQAGRLPEAIEHYQQALRLKPDYPEAHNNLAQALQQTGQIPEAIRHLEQALRLKPDVAEAHNNLGFVLVQAGRLPEAIEHYQQALRLNPEYQECYANLARAYAKLNQSAQAIATAQKAMDLARSAGENKVVQQIEGWLASYRESLTGGGDSSPKSEPKSPPRRPLTSD